MSKILDEVIIDFRNREARGVMKYGVTMDREDLLRHEWIQHMMEELMDAILYLKKIQMSQKEGMSLKKQINQLLSQLTAAERLTILEPLCDKYRKESRQEVERDLADFKLRKGIPRIKTDY